MLQLNRPVTYHTMTKSEKLLSELVELKKTELRRVRAYRILIMVLIVLPIVALIVLTTVAGIVAMNTASEFVEEFPAIMESFTEEQRDELFDMFMEEARAGIEGAVY